MTTPGRLLPRKPAGHTSDVFSRGLAFIDAMENIADLTWPQSVQTYGRMQFDPQLSAVLKAYTLPIRSAKWAVDPAGCRDEVVRQIADDFGLPVLGTDEEPGPARRRGVNWGNHLRLALKMLVYGYYPFAMAYEYMDGRYRLTKLAERLPATFLSIDSDDDGELVGAKQYNSERPIPAANLVWYVHEREGGNWAGRSMLRAAYGAWLLKHEMWHVLATGSRRFGTGVFQVEAPPGAPPNAIAEAQQLAGSVRVGEDAGVGLPSGFTARLVGLEGGVPDTLGFVRYLDQQMAQSVLASVLNLDASPNGSRALGETLVGLLEMSWAAIAAEVTGPATGLSVQAVTANWGENEPAPRIVAAEVNRPETTAEALAALVNVAAITPDPGLEGWLRQRYGVPQREMPPPAPAPALPGQPTQTNPAPPQAVVVP